MIEWTILVLALSAGALLGAVFFGGLWWTIRRAMASDAPALWFIGSFGLRTVVTVGGFYWVMQGDWRNLSACLLGFVAARGVVARATRPGTARRGAARRGTARRGTAGTP